VKHQSCSVIWDLPEDGQMRRKKKESSTLNLKTQFTITPH